MHKTDQFRADGDLIRVIIFFILAIAYTATAPEYHTTAIDSYNFAYLISEHEPFQVSTRLYSTLLMACIDAGPVLAGVTGQSRP